MSNSRADEDGGGNESGEVSFWQRPRVLMITGSILFALIVIVSLGSAAGVVIGLFVFAAVFLLVIGVTSFDKLLGALAVVRSRRAKQE